MFFLDNIKLIFYTALSLINTYYIFIYITYSTIDEFSLTI